MEKYLHRVMYYETDKMGLTHHSNYIRFMEEARVDLLEKLGWPYEKLEELGLFSPVIGLSCCYLSPTTFSDVIEISAEVLEYKGARLKVGYKMSKRDGTPVFEGVSEHCFVGKNGRPIRLSKVCPEFDEAMKSAVENGGK